MIVETLWREFEQLCIPQTAPMIQRQEMRRSFYAGVEGAMKVLREIGEDDVSDDAGVRVLESMNGELREFKKSMLRGEA